MPQKISYRRFVFHIESIDKRLKNAIVSDFLFMGDHHILRKNYRSTLGFFDKLRTTIFELSLTNRKTQLVSNNSACTQASYRQVV